MLPDTEEDSCTSLYGSQTGQFSKARTAIGVLFIKTTLNVPLNSVSGLNGYKDTLQPKPPSGIVFFHLANTKIIIDACL